MEAAKPQAERMLSEAVKQLPTDPALLSAFGVCRAAAWARGSCAGALSVDPDLIDALNNLGVLEIKAGHTGEAVKLWQKAFQHSPASSSLGRNIARAFCDNEHFNEAQTVILRVLEFNPDYVPAKKRLQNMNHEPPGCGSFRDERSRR